MQNALLAKKIVIGCDHAGFVLKETLRKYVETEFKIPVQDVGCYSEARVDYPDYGYQVAHAVSENFD
jgi:ribose 5-phosphate isomerase B